MNKSILGILSVENDFSKDCGRKGENIFDEMKKNGYPLLLFIEKSYLCNQQMKLFINLKLI